MSRRTRSRSAGLGHGDHGKRPRPVMNVTPLVDVVLVLLIIFMVVIPAAADGVQVEIPGILNPDEQTDKAAEPFLLSINTRGDLFFDDQAVEEPELRKLLRLARDRAPGRRIVVRADRNVRYGDARRLYLLVQDVGFPGVSLRVNRLGDDQEGGQ